MKKQWLCGALIVLNLALIWGNSALPGEESGAVSDWVMALFRFLPDTELAYTILRKAAHFSEFACLGLLTGWMSALLKNKTSLSLLGLGLAVACIDETIQYFVPGRASSLIDVWIDASGFTTGMIVLTLGYIIIKKRNLEETQK